MKMNQEYFKDDHEHNTVRKVDENNSLHPWTMEVFENNLDYYYRSLFHWELPEDCQAIKLIKLKFRSDHAVSQLKYCLDYNVCHVFLGGNTPNIIKKSPSYRWKFKENF